jgi:hypothetical protein
MSIQSLKPYPNIIEKINSYLEPMFINNNFILSIRNDKQYNNKLHYLTDNNVPFKYSLDYARYPESTMPFIIKLSKIMSIDDAYNILMNIPTRDYKIYNINIDEPLEKHISIVNKIETILYYNYVWSYILIKNNISIEMIKVLLHKLIDFYFFELLYYNKNINDFNVSLDMVIKSIESTMEYRKTFYKLRTAKVPHIIAYKLCKINNNCIDKIIEVANIGFYNVYNLFLACNFSEIQIDFLKLSRLGYITDEEFDKNKQHIFNNSITEILINTDYFKLKHTSYYEPLAKKQKT